MTFLCDHEQQRLAFGFRVTGYACKAKVELPSLGEYERQRAKFTLLPQSAATSVLVVAG
jgi:hypothetical protein